MIRNRPNTTPRNDECPVVCLLDLRGETCIEFAVCAVLEFLEDETLSKSQNDYKSGRHETHHDCARNSWHVTLQLSFQEAGINALHQI